jgi:hypothetical protein
VIARVLCCLVLFGLIGCRAEGRGRGAAAIDPAAYPPCDVPSDPYLPDKTVQGPGAPLWIRRFGCQADDRAMGVAIERDGHVVATGSFAGRVSFGDAPLVSGGTRDAFVARWDEEGKSVWSLRLGGVNSEARGTNLTLGARGELVVAGRFHGVLDATRPQLMSRGLDPFLLMMKQDGSFLWARRFDRAGTSDQGKVPVAADPFGGVLLPVAPSGSGATDGVVVRVDPSGDLPGQVPLPEGHASSLAVHADRTVLVAGHGGFQAPSTAPTGRGRFRVAAPGAAATVRQLFLASYDDKAQRTWLRTIGDVRAKSFGEPLIAVDADGSGYVAFTFQGGVDVGTGLLESGGGFDLVVMKVDRVGRTVWARAFPGPQGNEWVNAIAVDRAGNVVLGGAFERAVDFGGGPIMSTGPVSGFVARLDNLGRHVWSRVFGAQGSSAVVEAVALGSAGNVAVAGAFQGWTDFGGGLVPSSGAWDGFVALLGP